MGTPQLNFEWDRQKARQNLRKHGVSFEVAGTVFLDPVAVSIFDGAHSGEEERWVTIGREPSGSLVVVVHTFVETGPDEAAVRIISARHATKRERQVYEDGS